MKIVVKNIMTLVKEKQHARKERLHQQACADAQAMIDAHSGTK